METIGLNFLIEGHSSVNVKDIMRTLQTTLRTNSFTNTAIQWISQYNEEKIVMFPHLSKTFFFFISQDLKPFLFVFLDLSKYLF
jgi:hypothetical protein